MPVPRIRLRPDIDQAFSEGLPGGDGVSIDFNTNGVKVVAPAVDRDVPTPVFRVAPVLHVPARFEYRNRIGSAGERGHHGNRRWIAIAPIVFRKNPDELDHREVAILQRRIKVQGHVAMIDCFNRIDEVEKRTPRQITHTPPKRIHHVLGDNPLTISPPGVGMNSEYQCQAVIGEGNTIGKTRVKGDDLITCPGDQVLVAISGAAGIVGAPPSQRGKRIETVRCGQDQHPPFGSIRIEVFEMRVVGRVLEVMKERDSVSEFQFGRVQTIAGKSGNGHQHGQGRNQYASTQRQKRRRPGTEGTLRVDR